MNYNGKSYGKIIKFYLFFIQKDLRSFERLNLVLHNFVRLTVATLIQIFQKVSFFFVWQRIHKLFDVGNTQCCQLHGLICVQVRKSLFSNSDKSILKVL